MKSSDQVSAASTPRDRPIAWVFPLLIGVLGVLAAITLPFAPVWAEQTTVQWPAPDSPTMSSTAFFAPYRPIGLTATAPCHVLRDAAARNSSTTVLATATDGAGLLLRVAAGRAQVLLNGRLVASTVVGPSRCHVRVDSGPTGTTIVTQDGVLALKHEPIPEVQTFRTDLAPAQANGLTVTARTSSVFDVRSSTVKRSLMLIWALASALSLTWLWRLRRRARQLRQRRAGRRPRLASSVVDAAVVAVLGVWAVVGPLSDDDGFAAMIARNSAASGYQGNYYRWWNASETPFALVQHLLVPLTEVSLSPLWLRIPSTVLGAATWLVLARGLLPSVLSTGGVECAQRWSVRMLAGCCFLVCWLPFNLGVRPEAYVAFGITSVLTLLWRGSGVWALALATLVAGVTVTASPASVLLAAPVLVLAGRLGPLVRSGSTGRGELAARVAMLCCVGAVALALVFADQSLYSLAVATRWHDDFGPSVPWYDEISRYQYLFSADQDGTATKRVPVLLTAVLLPVVGLLLARRAEPDGAGTHSGAGPGLGPSAGRLAGVAFVGLMLLWLTPSKWSHYFGALAGVFTAFLVISIVLLARIGRGSVDRGSIDRVDRLPSAIGLAGAALVALVAGLAFSGPNAWWQPAFYDVPWAVGPIRPAGLPLDSPLLWLVVGVAGYVTVRTRRNRAVARQALAAAPALLAVAVMGVSVALLLGSFVAAPIREPSGSLALSNVRRLAGQPGCGPGDDVQVLPDVPGSVMSPVGPDPGRANGFAFGAGFDPAAPPPDPPGSGASAQLWGSLTDGPVNTGTLITPWFALPRIARDQELTLSVAGRTDDVNSLSLEFGAAIPSGTVSALTEVTPPDPLRSAPGRQPDHRLWRSIGVAASAVPPGANRVRIHAVDATSDQAGWLALTGPRLRQVRTLREFLAGHGPVLVAWPMAFLFPCVVDPVTVRDGLVQAPATVLETPRRYAGLSSVSTDPGSGGDFAPLSALGGLGEVTTRLAGRPDTDWGQLLLADYPTARDSYQVRVTRQEVSGLHGISPAPVPPENPPAHS